jgi:hypothetical protein
MRTENKQIAVQDEEVIINMRMSKCVYEAWKFQAEKIGVSMIDLLDVLIMYSPSPEYIAEKWPWYCGFPEEWKKQKANES